MKELICTSGQSSLGGYYKKKGIIVWNYLYSGGYRSAYWHYYAKLSKGEFKTKLTVQEYQDYQSGEKWTKDYRNVKLKLKEISKSKFKRQLKKLVGSTKRSKFKYHNNTTVNREKYLK